MIDSQRMAIVYVPTGHSDPWLARWLELEHIDSNAHVYSNAKLELGFQCQQCHRVEDPIQELRKGINASWRSRNRSVAERPITKFDHTPHMTIASLSDCTICHSLPDARVSANAAGMQLVSNGSLSHLDRWNAIPEFAPMRKESCADCHRAGAAGDSCIQCHNYHVLGPK